MKTDIDRLHKTILTGDTSRRCGKTLVLCHSIAGEVEVGKHRDIIVILPTVKDIDWIKHMFEDCVCEEHELKIVCSTKNITDTEYKRIWWLTPQQSCRFGGFHEPVIFDQELEVRELQNMIEERDSLNQQISAREQVLKDLRESQDLYYNHFGEW